MQEYFLNRIKIKNLVQTNDNDCCVYAYLSFHDIYFLSTTVSTNYKSLALYYIKDGDTVEQMLCSSYSFTFSSPALIQFLTNK